MFAILKDSHGIPAALFEIDKETPKRFYGKVVDTLDRDKWFYLRGLIRGRDQEEYCDKDIVIGIVRTEGAWFEVKENLILIKRTLKTRYNACEERMNEARATCRRDQAEAIVLAQNDAKGYLANVLA